MFSISQVCAIFLDLFYSFLLFCLAFLLLFFLFPRQVTEQLKSLKV